MRYINPRLTLTLTLLPLSPPKSGSKREFLHLALPVTIFVTGKRRHFKFGMCVEHSKSQPTDDKPSLT